MSDLLIGIHPVREALRAGTRPLHYVALSRERRDARLRELLRLARERGVPVRFESAAGLDRLAGSPRHQGVVAAPAEKELLAVADLLRPAAPTPAPTLLVALDGVEDPHNLGAILRSAAAAGADGVILPARRAAPLNATAARAAAGALEYLRVAQATNLAAALEEAKAAGFWSVGLAAEAPRRLWDLDFSSPILLVIGGEGRGLRPLIRARCDFLAGIPMRAGVASLNASAAAAVALFEIVRRRTEAGDAGGAEASRRPER